MAVAVDLRSDEVEIKRLARERASHKRSRGAKSKLRWREQTLEVEEQTLKSEFAVARYLGVEPSVSRAHGRDPGYDVVYEGYEIEVKYTEYASGRLPYNPELHSFEQDIWLLALVKGASFQVKLCGWVWRREMRKMWEPCPFDSDAFCLEQSQLSKCKELLTLYPKSFQPPKQGALF